MQYPNLLPSLMSKILNPIVKDDMTAVTERLGSLVYHFAGSRILITGYRGFLGNNFLAFFAYINQFALRKPARLTCIDSCVVPLDNMADGLTDDCEVIIGNIANNIVKNKYEYVLNCAGIASPSFYRRFPLETIEANAISLWNMLGRFSGKELKGFLYFSSSEIYGDPTTSNAIPTDEEYRGNVSCTGPRACYDESKRLGETICVTFAREKLLPIKIVRPFNGYGPFMRLDDQRVIPDFIRSALRNKVIEIYSDGRPTRTFCYVRDLIEGCLRALLLGKSGRPYNIGNPDNEISIGDLAAKIATLCGNVRIEQRYSRDPNYLSDNPQRRCPSIERAKSELGFLPAVSLDEGLHRMISWHRETSGIRKLEVV